MVIRACRTIVGREGSVSQLIPVILLIGGFLAIVFALRFAGRWHRH